MQRSPLTTSSVAAACCAFVIIITQRHSCAAFLTPSATTHSHAVAHKQNIHSGLQLIPGQGAQLEAAFNVECANKHRLADRDGSGSGGNNADGFIAASIESAATAPIAITDHHRPQGQNGGDTMVATADATSTNSNIETNKPPAAAAAVTTRSAARSFVSRVFSLPSAIHKKDNHLFHFGMIGSSLHDLLHLHQRHHGEDDVVMYPIVGFRIVCMPDTAASASESVASRIDGNIESNPLSSAVSSLSPTSTRCTMTVLPTVAHAACELMPLSCREEELYGWYSPVCHLNVYQENPCLQCDDGIQN